jgi:hypothetical protein
MDDQCEQAANDHEEVARYRFPMHGQYGYGEYNRHDSMNPLVFGVIDRSC